MATIKLKPNLFDYALNDTFDSWVWSTLNHGFFLSFTLAWCFMLTQVYAIGFGWTAISYLLLAGLIKLAVNGLVSYFAYKTNPALTPYLWLQFNQA
jgi:hypothetical protein